MSKHLPECHSRCTEQAFCACRSAECMCERLRECEARVTAAAVQRVEALPGYALRDTCLAAIKGEQ